MPRSWDGRSCLLERGWRSIGRSFPLSMGLRSCGVRRWFDSDRWSGGWKTESKTAGRHCPCAWDSRLLDRRLSYDSQVAE